MAASKAAHVLQHSVTRLHCAKEPCENRGNVSANEVHSEGTSRPPTQDESGEATFESLATVPQQQHNIQLCQLGNQEVPADSTA